MSSQALEPLADALDHLGEAGRYEEDALVIGRIVRRLGDDAGIERRKPCALLEAAQLAERREEARAVRLEGALLAAHAELQRVPVQPRDSREGLRVHGLGGLSEGAVQ